MKTRISGLSCLLVVMTMLLLTVGCVGTTKVGELQRESRTIELADARSVHVDIKMGSGKLKVTGGADKLLDAYFFYNVAEWKPEVDYHVSDSLGKLIIHQPSSQGIGGIPLGNVRYEWDLRFNNDVPIKMNVNLGAGKNYLKLGNLSLTSLDVDTGAGSVILDLTRSPSLKKLDLNMGAGDVKVDLTGDWKNDLSAYINGGIGRISLRFPGEVGVYVHADRGIGQINASGLKKDGNVYTNDAYGQSKVTLNIDIDAGIGQINLELAE